MEEMKTERHFKLTDQTLNYDGATLHRIEALIDLPQHNVKKGDLGGFIEREDNLRDDAWVAGNAMVYDNAEVYGNAIVSDNAVIHERAQIYGDTKISGNVKVCDHAVIGGTSNIGGRVVIGDDMQIIDNNIDGDDFVIV